MRSAFFVVLPSRHCPNISIPLLHYSGAIYYKCITKARIVMATIYYKIFKHHKKADGKYNVKYCLTHKGKQVYISSPHNVSDKQLIKTSMKLRDDSVLSEVLAEIAGLMAKVRRLGVGIDGMTAKDVLQRITTDEGPQGVDFIAFCRKHIAELKVAGRTGTARSLQPVVNHLVDYFESEKVMADQITSGALRGLEAYLSRPGRITRINQFGDEVVTHRAAMGSSGLHTTMRDLRVLFNACRREYNTELHTAINHYPFEFYTLPKPAPARKRGADLSVEDVAAIRDLKARSMSRRELARDMFMLSFYLCGMNAKDLLDQIWVVDNGRVTYGRSKTKDRRSDGAVISVAVPEPARVLLDRYTARHIRNRYSGYDTFYSALKHGMKEVSAALGKPATFYHARHTFATLAHNRCGFSKDEIAAALNHVDQSRRVTERYIAVDWSVVDRVQAGVLALLPAKDVI